MRFGYYLPLDAKPMLTNLLFFLTENDTWYDIGSTEQRIQDYMDACAEAPKGVPVSHYLLKVTQKVIVVGTKPTKTR